MRKIIQKLSAVIMCLMLAAAGLAGLPGINLQAAQKTGYVLLNIPYSAFYKAEVDGGVDAVTAATATKKRNTGLAAGTWHTDENSAGIEGVTYPVKVKDMDAFKAAVAKIGGIPVTDGDSLSYELTVRGNVQSYNLTGKEVLLERPAYSYYELAEAPKYYKELTIGSDGSFSFGKINSDPVYKTVNAFDYVADRHVDYAMKIEDLVKEEITSDVSVCGVFVTVNGKNYALGHVVNIWRQNQIGWNKDSAGLADLAEGPEVSAITYLTSSGVYTYITEKALNELKEEAKANLEKTYPVSKFQKALQDKAGKLLNSAKEAIDQASDPDKIAAEEAAALKQLKALSKQLVGGQKFTAGGKSYVVLSVAKKTAALTGVNNARSITVPDTVKCTGTNLKVVQINAGALKGSKIRKVTIGKNIAVMKAGAFKGSKATSLVIRTKKLTRKSVKGALKGSKVKKIKVKPGSAKVNKKYVKKYKKIFAKKVSGKKVTVK